VARLLRCRIDVMAPRINRHGPAHVAAMRRGLEDWLRWNKMESLDDMNGIVSLETTRDPAAFERAHYIRTLHSWTK
jgi:dihydroorotate dehydrogenase (fumarate)